MDSEMVGKKIHIFYEDGTQRVSRKDGKCTSNSDREIILDHCIVIMRNRIVRIEILGEQQ